MKINLKLDTKQNTKREYFLLSFLSNLQIFIPFRVFFWGALL